MSGASAEPTPGRLTEDPTPPRLTEDPTTARLTEDPTSPRLSEDPTPHRLSEDPSRRRLSEERDRRRLSEERVEALLRLDVVTIFPDYFAPLSLSLVGKAIDNELVSVGVHDLRDFTHDRHRTVDDTPYGGGAGMVMKPEPWGECLDALLSDADAPPLDRTTLVVPTPSGAPFKQSDAVELATRDRLIFACGRYEGIDHRVVEHAGERVEVREVSLGDYVLNGGEVAALAMIEAVVRLIPGVIGNPESLTEESHSGQLAGLLEYPVYTKPPSWRGLDVPEVLFSGHHARIAEWRRAQATALTRARRPDLLGD